MYLIPIGNHEWKTWRKKGLSKNKTVRRKKEVNEAIRERKYIQVRKVDIDSVD